MVFVKSHIGVTISMTHAGWIGDFVTFIRPELIEAPLALETEVFLGTNLLVSVKHLSRELSIDNCDVNCFYQDAVVVDEV